MQQFQNYILGNWVSGSGIETSAFHAITGKEIGTASNFTIRIGLFIVIQLYLKKLLNILHQLDALIKCVHVFVA